MDVPLKIMSRLMSMLPDSAFRFCSGRILFFLEFKKLHDIFRFADNSMQALMYIDRYIMMVGESYSEKLDKKTDYLIKVCSRPQRNRSIVTTVV